MSSFCQVSVMNIEEMAKKLSMPQKILVALAYLHG